MIKSGELQTVLSKKREDETIAHAVQRLRREGVLPARAVDPGVAFARRSAVKAYLAERGCRSGKGVVDALEKVIAITLDAAVTTARRDHRKTVKPQDVR